MSLEHAFIILVVWDNKTVHNPAIKQDAWVENGLLKGLLIPSKHFKPESCFSMFFKRWNCLTHRRENEDFWKWPSNTWKIVHACRGWIKENWLFLMLKIWYKYKATFLGLVLSKDFSIIWACGLKIWVRGFLLKGSLVLKIQNF